MGVVLQLGLEEVSLISSQLEICFNLKSAKFSKDP